MMNAFVPIRINPQAEALVILSRPTRRITRRQSVNTLDINPPQPIMPPMPPRRMSISGIPPVSQKQQVATRAQILQQLGMPLLLQLDQNDTDDNSNSGNEAGAAGTVNEVSFGNIYFTIIKNQNYKNIF